MKNVQTIIFIFEDLLENCKINLIFQNFLSPSFMLLFSFIWHLTYSNTGMLNYSSKWQAAVWIKYEIFKKKMSLPVLKPKLWLVG